MRLTEKQKKVNIHTWNFDAEDRIDLDEFRKEIKTILEKAEGKQGFAEIYLDDDDGCSYWLDNIIIYEIVDKTEEDLERERIKAKTEAILEEEREREEYLKLKAKFEGGK